MSDQSDTTADKPAYRTPMPFLAEHKRSPTVKRDGVAVWLREQIAYLEAIGRTQFGEGCLSAYKTTLKEVTDAE